MTARPAIDPGAPARSGLGEVMLTARAAAVAVLDAPARGGGAAADLEALRRLPAALALLTPADAQEALLALAVIRDLIDPASGRPDVDSAGTATAIVDRLAWWLIEGMGAEPAAPEVTFFAGESFGRRSQRGQ